MKDSDREKIALFRYGIIAPLLNGQVKCSEYLAQISGITHDVPHYGFKEYNPKTIESWVRIYRRFGFDGLKPKKRSDVGKSRAMSQELKEKLLNLRKENRHISAMLFYQLLISSGVILPSDVSYSSVYRFLKRHQLLGGEKILDAERKRFAYDAVNVLWQGDMSYGPYIKVNGKKVRTFLFAFLDDCSRLVTSAAFTLSENFDALKGIFKDALIRRGIPKIVYVDNGKIYRSEHFNVICASIGINLTHTQPYDPASKGKIERFFGTVRQRFLPLLNEQDLSSLDNLNTAFSRWLESDYNRKVHSATGKTPLDIFMSQFNSVRLVNDPKALDALFLRRVQRKVKHDCTVSVNNLLFEVPPQFAGQKIEVRFEGENPDVIYIYSDGKEIAHGKRVVFSDNALIKRGKNIRQTEALSFLNLISKEEGGIKHV